MFSRRSTTAKCDLYVTAEWPEHLAQMAERGHRLLYDLGLKFRGGGSIFDDDRVCSWTSATFKASSPEEVIEFAEGWAELASKEAGISVKGVRAGALTTGWLVATVSAEDLARVARLQEDARNKLRR